MVPSGMKERRVDRSEVVSERHSTGADRAREVWRNKNAANVDLYQKSRKSVQSPWMYKQ